MVKNPIKVLLARAVNFYRESSVKPLAGILRRWYLKYVQPKMRERKLVLAKIDGIKYELDLNQPSELETYYGGGYEPKVIKMINDHIKPGMTAVDVGARIGLHTMRLKKLAGQNGKVFAFDPDKETFLRLIKNAKLNNFQIMAENIALSDQNKEGEITLDEFAQLNQIGSLDFIKIDTDGWEYRILQGGAETIKKYKPIMVVEFNKSLLENGELKLMTDLLRSWGYSFSPYCEKEILAKGNVNVLCK